MLYGPDGCRGDVRFAEVLQHELHRIADAEEKKNKLLEEILKELQKGKEKGND